MPLWALLFLVLDRFIKQYSLSGRSFFYGSIHPTLVFILSIPGSIVHWFSLVMLCIACAFAWFYWKTSSIGFRKRIDVFLLLILGGGASNVFDRFVYGGAIDMFAIPGLTLFNLADVALIGGACCLAYEVWHQKYIQGH